MIFEAIIFFGGGLVGFLLFFEIFWIVLNKIQPGAFSESHYQDRVKLLGELGKWLYGPDPATLIQNVETSQPAKPQISSQPIPKADKAVVQDEKTNGAKGEESGPKQTDFDDKENVSHLTEIGNVEPLDDGAQTDPGCRSNPEIHQNLASDASEIDPKLELPITIEEIRVALESLEKNQTELAEAIGVSRFYISKLLAGKKPLTSDLQGHCRKAIEAWEVDRLKALPDEAGQQVNRVI